MQGTNSLLRRSHPDQEGTNRAIGRKRKLFSEIIPIFSCFHPTLIYNESGKWDELELQKDNSVNQALNLALKEEGNLKHFPRKKLHPEARCVFR